MTTYIFPGQGSQERGMGGALFDHFGTLTAKADALLGYSVKELCLKDPDNRLSQTQFTQPALYVVNALTYLKSIQQAGRKPDYVAGHSLGEYNALLAAGAFDFETGLKLVKKRGELMCQATGGAMAAVIGLIAEKVETVLQANGSRNIRIANYNTPSQIVVAGPKADIDAAQRVFEEAGAKLYLVLNVSGAFHTPYMRQARDAFEEYLKGFEFSDLSLPVISNVHARPYRQREVKENLIEQITHGVRWTDSICYLMGQGETDFQEIGPGTVLTGLVSYIRKEAQPLVATKEEYGREPADGRNVKQNVPVIGSPRHAGPARIQRGDEISGQGTPQKRGEGVLPRITPTSLGSAEYKRDYGVKYAYAAGGMYRGIASKELVVRMGKAGFMSYFGTGGLGLDEVERTIQYLQRELGSGQDFGMNLVHNLSMPQLEDQTVSLVIKHKVRNVEAAAYMDVTPSLVRYRLKGLHRDTQGAISISNRIQAKVSRPEVAEAFLSPAPERIVKGLVEARQITQEEAELSREVPMADDLCVEADSGGHTDRGVAYVLMPAMMRLRDEMTKKYGYSKRIRVGAAGGIGTPEAAAAAFVLGADFILTGSINQCTVEARISEAVKDLLAQMNVQDTDYAPAGDLFEMGAKVQVLKKGLFFPARANKLYDLYRQYNSLDEIDERTKSQIQERYFGRSFEEVYKEAKAYYPAEEIEMAERSPKRKMALIFRWYFGYGSNLALNGSEEHRVNYQIHTGPALGAFNQWVKGTPLESWRNRHVDEIAERLMQETAELLNRRFSTLLSV